MGLTASVLLALFLVDGQLEASSGGPPNCDDGHVCTDDSCHPTTGCVHTSNTAPCSDGNACAVGDVCSGGRCVRGATSIIFVFGRLTFRFAFGINSKPSLL